LRIEIDFSLTSNRIVLVINHLVNKKGKPKKIQMDNGAEFIAYITNDWSEMHEIEFKYIQPRKPTQNAFVERFNGSYRRGVLNKYIFEDIDQERELTQIRMDDYKNYKAHDSLGSTSPVRYAQEQRAAAAKLTLK
jgi:putative transposase